VKTVARMIRKECIVDLKGDTKRDVLMELIDAIARAPEVTDKNDFFTAIMEREKAMSTGIGEGFALPHAQANSVKGLVIAVGIKKKGVDFDAIDGRLVHLVIMIGANPKKHNAYLKILAKVCSLIKDPEFGDKLRNASSRDAVFELFQSNLPSTISTFLARLRTCG
jgi:fructose-specific phosphotransferase system IIA component